MSDLAHTQCLDAQSLHPAHYFRTLLSQAHFAGFIDDIALAHIQQQCFALLTQQTGKYTRGQSSSVRVETAQSLLESISYTISLALKQEKNTEAAAYALAAQPLNALFDRGRQIIESQISEAKRLLQYAQLNRIATANAAYNDTVSTGLAHFFSAYDKDFTAHETPASIDYPLCREVHRLVGIEYIRRYLMQMTLEDAFCRCFADIDALLRGHHSGFADLLVNIFEIVLAAAAGCVLCGKPAVSTNITPSDRHYLMQTLMPMPQKKRRAALRDTASRICCELRITNAALCAYIRDACIRIAPRLQTALQTGRLDAFFVSRKRPKPPGAVFKDRPKMSDKRFRSITEEIRSCPSAQGKADIIRGEIHSFADLKDVLAASCIWPNEFAIVFASLDDTTFALLSRSVPPTGSDHFTESEKEWHYAFHEYFAGLDNDQKSRITAMAQSLGET